MARWLYGIFVAIDANFQMKRKAVSSDVADPGLSVDGLTLWKKLHTSLILANTSMNHNLYIIQVVH